MISTYEQQKAKQLAQNLDASLRQDQVEVLNRVGAILGGPQKLAQLHGLIGHKAPGYVDIVRGQFSDPEDFYTRWIAGLLRSVRARDEAEAAKYGRAYKTSGDHKIIRFLDDPVVASYVKRFLERTFYRQLLARTRAKPHESLWSVWFGQNAMIWGLLIAPAYRQGEWVNDVSEVRRAPYMYWTIGHVLHEGLIDPQAAQPYRFKDLNDLLQFYRSILKRVSNSLYEKAIVDHYVAYLNQSPNPLSEPFLIPEFRYARTATKHVYRLDYSVFNSHIMKFVGFELSPFSTHMQIAGTGKRTQKDINRELAENWEKEMGKRNAYFREYDVSVVTFTDSLLRNIDQCFAEIEDMLRARSPEPLKLDMQMAELKAYAAML